MKKRVLSVNKETKVFLIAAPEVSESAVRSLLKGDSRIRAWWNHLPGVYLVSSTASSSELANLIADNLDGASVLVSRINIKETDGWLPEKAWPWIRKREDEGSNKSDPNGES